MWYDIKRPVIVASVILMFCIGCTLLKKSTKNTQQNRQESNEQTYLGRVDLKTANKETKIYSFWKDSLLYQYQHILENTQEAKHTELGGHKNQVSKQQQELKKTEPPDLWIYGTIVIAGFLIFAVRFWLKRTK